MSARRAVFFAVSNSFAITVDVSVKGGCTLWDPHETHVVFVEIRDTSVGVSEPLIQRGIVTVVSPTHVYLCMCTFGSRHKDSLPPPQKLHCTVTVIRAGASLSLLVRWLFGVFTSWKKV